jgi:RimJ/RimL family protein N-acetyltransferase
VRLLYGHDADVEKFVADLIPNVSEHGFGNCRAIGIINADGLLIAGMVFHHWWPESGTIEFSGAATTPHWMTRHILDELFGYAFDKVGVQMLTTRNSGSNKRLHRQLATYGFERFDIPRLFGRRENGVLWTLTEEAFRAGRFHAQGNMLGRRLRQAANGNDVVL